MPNIRIANAPCSWGSLEFEALEGEGIACEEMLEDLVETGYRGTELGDWGYMPTDPAGLHAELAGRELVLLGAFVPVALNDASRHADGEKETLKVARLLGAVSEIGRYDRPPFLVLADDNGCSLSVSGEFPRRYFSCSRTGCTQECRRGRRIEGNSVTTIYCEC